MHTGKIKAAERGASGALALATVLPNRNTAGGCPGFRTIAGLPLGMPYP